MKYKMINDFCDCKYRTLEEFIEAVVGTSDDGFMTVLTAKKVLGQRRIKFTRLDMAAATAQEIGDLEDEFHNAVEQHVAFIGVCNDE